MDPRKAGKSYKILDSSGNPVVNSEIRINLINHEFLFGVNGFDALPYLFAQNDDFKRKAAERLEYIYKVFNYVTLPFYWGGFENKEGEPDTEAMLKAARMFKDKGITVKGHPLCWHTVCADWLLKYDNKTIMEKQLARIKREVSDFKGLIDMWDVINEVCIMPIFDKYDNAVTRICNEYGSVPLVKSVFDETIKYNSGATLLLNDFNTTDKYAELIEKCLDFGVRIDVIGIQSHQHQGYWGAEKLNSVLERFSKFNIPIHFTENTILSGTTIPDYIEDLNDWKVDEWPSTPELEELQMNQMKEMYEILFAHPLVKAVSNWDLCDGAWLGAPSGVIRKDNTPKPAYKMLDDLINNKWHTSVVSKTDDNGFVYIEGYKGTYDITVSDKKTTFTLSDSDSDLIIRI